MYIYILYNVYIKSYMCIHIWYVCIYNTINVLFSIFILYWNIIDKQCVVVSGIRQSDSAIYRERVRYDSATNTHTRMLSLLFSC